MDIGHLLFLVEKEIANFLDLSKLKLMTIAVGLSAGKQHIDL